CNLIVPFHEITFELFENLTCHFVDYQPTLSRLWQFKSDHRVVLERIGMVLVQYKVTSTNQIPCVQRSFNRTTTGLSSVKVTLPVNSGNHNLCMCQINSHVGTPVQHPPDDLIFLQSWLTLYIQFLDVPADRHRMAQHSCQVGLHRRTTQRIREICFGQRSL